MIRELTLVWSGEERRIEIEQKTNRRKKKLKKEEWNGRINKNKNLEQNKKNHGGEMKVDMVHATSGSGMFKSIPPQLSLSF